MKLSQAQSRCLIAYHDEIEKAEGDSIPAIYIHRYEGLEYGARGSNGRSWEIPDATLKGMVKRGLLEVERALDGDKRFGVRYVYRITDEGKLHLGRANQVMKTLVENYEARKAEAKKLSDERKAKAEARRAEFKEAMGFEFEPYSYSNTVPGCERIRVSESYGGYYNLELKYSGFDDHLTLDELQALTGMLVRVVQEFEDTKEKEEES